MSFIRYNNEDSVISSETVVRGLWSGDKDRLTTFAIPSSYSEYYLDVFQADPSLQDSSVQFSVQYGHINGANSIPINPNVPENTPSKVVYGQYRNLVYGTETAKFSFDGANISEDIFVINISRSRYKEALRPGSFSLKLSFNGTTYLLKDDSNTSSITRFIGENRYYNILEGSNPNPVGFLFPDLNIIIINATSSISAAIPPITATNNHLRIYNSILEGADFRLQSSETVSSRFFFTRIKNGEFNYTTNPSIIDDNGNLLYVTLINNPQTYITTVGMYNDNNELLAVAKLSKPLVKDFTKEALIRIKLDY